MPPLPPPPQREVRINWHVSSWCNYSCSYCPVLVFRKRAANGEKQAHSFDYYPAAAWVEALRALPHPRMLLKLTGGEPMLDRENVRAALAGVTADPRFEIAIDTNGSWEPGFFADLDKRRIFLNIAYHPQETPFEAFFKRLHKIRDAGFCVAMVNLVLDPDDIDALAAILGQLEGDGFFVNLSALQSWGVYASRATRTAREIELVERYNTPLDIKYKLLNPPSRGRLCRYPARSYYLQYDGLMRVFCTGIESNLFTDGPPPLPEAALPCPYDHCIACNEMYRDLEDEPLVPYPGRLHTYLEYAEEVREARRRRRRRETLERWPGGRLAARWLDGEAQPSLQQELEARWAAARQEKAARQQMLIAVDAIRPAVPATPLFGAMDVYQETVRSRDRILLSGWAAAREQGAPVKEVRILLDGKPLAAVHEFHDRPDIAARFGRPELEQCGWRTMVYLPALEEGEHPLEAQAVGFDGAAAPLRVHSLKVIR